MGIDGTVMRCHNCVSVKHFASSCPHQQCGTEEAHTTVHITLIAGKGETEQCYLLGECLGYGALDSACTKTVAGETWVNEYLSTLSAQELTKVNKSKRKSMSVFRFGDGVVSESLKPLCLPFVIGSKTVSIEVDVISNKIPLLIGKPTMTVLGMKIDFARHTAVVDGQLLKLGCTSAGHYYLPICSYAKENCKFVFSVERLLGTSVVEKKHKALKLHRQMCHASSDRLQRLLKNAEVNDHEFLKLVKSCCDSCEFCRKYKKPFSRPVVGFPVAEKFNHVVCMDLKEVEKGKTWIMHMIDAAT